MPPRTDEAGLAALAERAGLVLDPAQRAGLLPAWHAVEALLESLRGPAPGIAPGSAAAASAEPAITYRPAAAAAAGRGA